MSSRYGQSITWGTVNAPRPFTGTCTRWSYKEQVQRFLDDDEAGDNRAMVLHSRKYNWGFDAKVTDTSTDFLDLSSGAAVAITANLGEPVTGGVILCNRASEDWQLGQAKKVSAGGIHYPDMTQASPTLAGNATSAFVPDPASLGIAYPGSKLIWGTFGLAHGAGIVHGLTITQELQLAEDDMSPAGTILGVTAHGYLRTIRLKLLVPPSATIPLARATLAFTTSPAITRAANYKIEEVEQMREDKRGKMLDIGAVWIPPLG